MNINSANTNHQPEVTKHGRVIYAIGQKEFCPITKDEYDDIAKANRGLIALLHIEEKFDIFIENYLELEQELLSIALRDMATFEHSPQAFQDTRGVVNRRLLNFLSAGRLYIDQIKRHLSEIDQGVLASTNKLISDIYDGNASFRITEALRNYVQHCGFPTHAISHSWKRITSDKSVRLQFFVSPTVDHDELAKDKTFKKQALTDLQAMSVKGRVKLMPCVRQYVELMGGIHVQLRKSLEQHREEWDKCFAETMSKFAAMYPTTELTGLAAVVLSDAAGWLGKVEIYSAVIDLRKRLTEKSFNFANLSKRYVASAE